jgi:hypothetical protein
MSDNYNGRGREPPRTNDNRHRLSDHSEDHSGAIPRTVEAQKRLVEEWLKEIPRAEFETPQVVRLRKFLFVQVQDLIENWRALGIEDQFERLREIAIRSSVQPKSVQAFVGKILGQKRILSQRVFSNLVKEVKGGRV